MTIDKARAPPYNTATVKTARNASAQDRVSLSGADRKFRDAAPSGTRIAIAYQTRIARESELERVS